ncbi:MAG: ribosome silencing factor [bacterium]|nr:ribosome silencing factor [bacterium]
MIDLPPEELASVAADAMDGKQGRDIVILDMGDLLGIVDTFVIASGASKRQVRTLAEEVDGELERYGRTPLRLEGMDTAEWVLLDYGDLTVHIFQPAARDLYSLERLWGDAPRVSWAPPRGADG